jgi:hypothetical protein
LLALFLLPLLLGVAGAAPGGAAVAAPSNQSGPATPAPEWDALFDRTSGWTGADGIYSIPLNGDERAGGANSSTTFWTFSDTFIGTVDSTDKRSADTVLVNNTMALLQGGSPNPASMQFVWGSDVAGKPAARVIPNTSASHWFWPNDGIALNGTIYLYSLRMQPGSDPTFPFQTVGVSLLSSPASSPQPFASYSQVDAPLYLPASRGAGDVTYGMAVLPNTSAAGAPRPDEYLYVYGVRNDRSKKLLVARVRPADITRFSEYRFWDGRTWVSSIRSAVAVTSRISSEFSVSPLADGRYILVFQLDGLSGNVAVRYGDSPVGPWGAPIVIYTCPEDTLTPNTYTYSAKAHPHLSQPGELLISYNVNTFDFNEHLNNADIYRPRFIRFRP